MAHIDMNKYRIFKSIYKRKICVGRKVKGCYGVHSDEITLPTEELRTFGTSGLSKWEIYIGQDKVGYKLFREIETKESLKKDGALVIEGDRIAIHDAIYDVDHNCYNIYIDMIEYAEDDITDEVEELIRLKNDEIFYNSITITHEPVDNIKNPLIKEDMSPLQKVIKKWFRK